MSKIINIQLRLILIVTILNPIYADEIEVKRLHQLPESIAESRELFRLTYIPITYISSDFDASNVEKLKVSINEVRGSLWMVNEKSKIMLNLDLEDLVQDQEVKINEKDNVFSPPNLSYLIIGKNKKFWKARIYDDGKFELIQLVKISWEIPNLYCAYPKGGYFIGNSIGLLKFIPEKIWEKTLINP